MSIIIENPMKKINKTIIFIAATLIPIYIGEKIGDWFSAFFFPNHRILCEFGGVVLVSVIIYLVQILLPKQHDKE